MNATLKLGLVGVDAPAEAYLRDAVIGNDDVEAIACFGEEDHARTFATTWGLELRSSIRDMVSGPRGVHILIVCTPPAEQLQNVRDIVSAADASWHRPGILLARPAAAPEQHRAMAAAAQHQGLPLTVGYPWAHGAVRWIRELVEAGILGKIRIRTEWARTAQSAAPAANMLADPADLALAVHGGDVERVTALSHTEGAIDGTAQLADDASLSFSMRSGAALEQDRWVFEVSGEHGTAALEWHRLGHEHAVLVPWALVDPTDALLGVGADAGYASANEVRVAQAARTRIRLQPTGYVPSLADCRRRLVDDLVDCVRSRGSGHYRTPLVTPDRAAAVGGLIAAATASTHRRGDWVDLTIGR